MPPSLGYRSFDELVPRFFVSGVGAAGTIRVSFRGTLRGRRSNLLLIAGRDHYVDAFERELTSENRFANSALRHND